MGSLSNKVLTANQTIIIPINLVLTDKSISIKTMTHDICIKPSVIKQKDGFRIRTHLKYHHEKPLSVKRL